jgi:hypothetical protein
MKCDSLLSEHTPDTQCEDAEHRAALARRADGAGSWSPIVRSRTEGGPRDFLDGEPINCGSGLELQAIEYRSDDYGEFTVKLPSGVRVRYELDRGEIVFYGGIAGHEFTSPHHAWMRFRWPERRH